MSEDFSMKLLTDFFKSKKNNFNTAYWNHDDLIEFLWESKSYLVETYKEPVTIKGFVKLDSNFNRRRYLIGFDIHSDSIINGIDSVGFIKYDASNATKWQTARSDGYMLDFIWRNISKSVFYGVNNIAKIEAPVYNPLWCQICMEEKNNCSHDSFIVCRDCADSDAYSFVNRKYINKVKKDAWGKGLLYYKRMIEENRNPADLSSKQKLYLIRRGLTDVYKIGISVDPKHRMKSIQSSNSEKLSLVHTVKANSARELELSLHKEFDDNRLNGEWFELNESQVDFIKSL